MARSKEQRLQSATELLDRAGFSWRIVPGTRHYHLLAHRPSQPEALVCVLSRGTNKHDDEYDAFVARRFVRQFLNKRGVRL